MIHPDVLARIPLTARHVLELGSRDGALAARFRWRNPAVRWTGIEPDPAQAEASRAHVDAIIARDPDGLDEAALAPLKDGPAPDVLVVQQGLERLSDPARVLGLLVARLAPGGTAVLAFPHAGHWSALKAVLIGSQAAAAVPRAFTLDSARELVQGAGLVLRKQRGRELPAEDETQQRVLAAAGPLLEALGEPAEAGLARLRTLDYVLVAQKTPLPAFLEAHQLVMVRQLMEARVEPPWAALATLPSVSPTMSDTSLRRGPLIPNAPKVLVIQRQLVGELETWTAYMRRLIHDGWVLVAEWDDHPDLLPSPARENWQKHPWLPMTMVHACEVSTPRLAEAFREHNPETEVFENALMEAPPLATRDPGTIRILYASVSRPGVARMISPALDAASDDPRVEIVVVGDEKLFASTRALRKRYLPLQDYAGYLDLLGRSDIVLAPLKGLPSELYKSPLKALEAGARGALMMGSPAIYEDVVEHGRTGWLPRSQEEWTGLLLRAIADPQERRTMAEAAWRRVRECHLQAQQVGRREAWYRGLAARREALTESVYRRHPHLRP